MPLPDLPASLKAIKPYLELSKQLAAQPVIAYHCELHALQTAMEQRANIPKADMGFILSLMDECEADKTKLGEHDDANVLCENYAQELFTKADDQDRAGQSTLPVAKTFLSSAQLMEACKQFGELPEDMNEKIKYAKWRFVEICKATKERRPPAPPRGLEGSDDAPAAPSEPVAATLPMTLEPPSMPPPGPPSVDPAGLMPPANVPGAPMPPYGGAAPPEYMALPPAPPPGVVPPAPPAYDMGGLPPAPPVYDAGGMPQPPSYSALPPTPGAVGGPPPPAGYGAPLPARAPSGFTPSRTQMMEALKLCQNAASSLQFQDSDTAVSQLHQAISVLITPPAQPTEPAQ